jgi:guanosine-3',5'-bis(diphosphate) 3'-pyrophosphohydrolase
MNIEARIIIRALKFAAAKHRDQRRKDRESSPYINHPIELANILANEAGISDIDVLTAAILHDTVEDTETTEQELIAEFGARIANIVMEVSDEKSLTKEKRKQLQIDHAADISTEAKLVKFADKISNVRDIASSPPIGWSLQRQQEYFDWAKQVIDRMRGTHAVLEELFDRAFDAKP